MTTKKPTQLDIYNRKIAEYTTKIDHWEASDSPDAMGVIEDLSSKWCDFVTLRRNLISRLARREKKLEADKWKAGLVPIMVSAAVARSKSRQE